MIEHLRRYNKDLDPVYDDTKDILMLSSGSSGNSLIIKPYQLIIDLGLSYKHYDNHLLKQIKYICLTHEHGDHFNVSTINQIMKNHPHITFIMRNNLYNILVSRFKKHNYELKQNNIYIIEPNQDDVFDINNNEVIVINAHQTDHFDIENTAYTIKGSVDVDLYESPTILYASDLISTNKTSNGDGLPQDEKYDLMFLEANFDHERLIKELINDIQSNNTSLNEYQQKHLLKDLNSLLTNFDKDKLHYIFENKLYAPKAQGNLRHLSENDAFRYVRHHLSNDGVFIPLHASSTFGTFNQI